MLKEVKKKLNKYKSLCFKMLSIFKYSLISHFKLSFSFKPFCTTKDIRRGIFLMIKYTLNFWWFGVLEIILLGEFTFC